MPDSHNDNQRGWLIVAGAGGGQEADALGARPAGGAVEAGGGASCLMDQEHARSVVPRKGAPEEHEVFFSLRHSGVLATSAGPPRLDGREAVGVDGDNRGGAGPRKRAWIAPRIWDGSPGGRQFETSPVKDVDHADQALAAGT